MIGMLEAVGEILWIYFLRSELKVYSSRVVHTSNVQHGNTPLNMITHHYTNHVFTCYCITIYATVRLVYTIINYKFSYRSLIIVYFYMFVLSYFFIYAKEIIINNASIIPQWW